ncbi:hypothetical protein [Undibacter mobilis]|nr:hypothetical protein [Undibacter mobilis]
MAAAAAFGFLAHRIRGLKRSFWRHADGIIAAWSAINVRSR